MDLKTYFIILTYVYGHNERFDVCSDDYDHYPSEEEIKKEMVELQSKGYVVYSSKVEKQYRPIN